MNIKPLLRASLPLFLAHFAWTQETPLTPAQVRDSIELFSSQIAGDSLVESEYVGVEGTQSRQFSRFTRILAIASDTQLMDLTDHASPAVRLYAYYGLTWKNPPLLIEALRNHLDDTAHIQTVNGTIQAESTVFAEAIYWAEEQLVRGNPKGLNKEGKTFIHKEYMAILAQQHDRRRAEKHQDK